MKNYLLLITLGLFLFSSNAYSQDNSDATDESQENSEKTDKPYDRFSIELNVGANRTDGYYSPGFYQTNAEDDFSFGGISRFDLGLRYMLNEKFGLKFSGAYDMFESYSDNSADFETNLLRFNFEGVANFRSILNFDSFSKRFGLLGHAGIHYGFFGDGEDNGAGSNGGDALIEGTDEVFGFTVGLTPQYRLSNTFVLTADASFIKNYRQQQTWDFNPAPPESNLNAEFMTFSLGITAYLGKHDVHADFYNPADKTKEEMDMMKDKLAALEEKLNNKADKTDQVPDYIKNFVQNYHNNNMPDNFVTNFGESLVEDGYIRIFFDFDADMPNATSVDDVAALINFMENNEDAKVELIGMTDVLGSDSYNDDLSQRRAKNVYDILVEVGIDPSRLEHRGNGKNPVYTSKNDYIRMLARTVTVKLK
jgi:OOP family OmpA-OmpF porin